MTLIKSHTDRCCPRCGTNYHFRLPPNFLQTYILFFLPLRRYFCARCVKPRLVWIGKKRK